MDGQDTKYDSLYGGSTKVSCPSIPYPVHPVIDGGIQTLSCSSC